SVARAGGGGGDPARRAVTRGPHHAFAGRCPATAGDRGGRDRSEASGAGGARRTAAPSPPRSRDVPAGGRDDRGGERPENAGRGRRAQRATARTGRPGAVTRLGARPAASPH